MMSMPIEPELNDPTVLVFIPVKNGAQYLSECIDSVRSQSYTDWRLIVSDNVSTDQTANIVRAYMKIDKRIRWFRHDLDVGMVGNFNSCLDRCTSQFHAILSHDDKYTSNSALSDALQAMTKFPDVTAVYSRMAWIDQKSHLIASPKSAHVGLVDADIVAIESIATCRNRFGVPLLIRSNAVESHRYEAQFHHTADVDFSIAIGSNRQCYFFEDARFAARFHAANGTMRNVGPVRRELVKVASKHNIPVGFSRAIRMWVHHTWTVFLKTGFFFYLDKFR